MEIRRATGNRLTGFRDGRPIFFIEYHGSPPGVPIKDEGWRLYEARWHKTRFGQPVINKYPRKKLIDVFESRSEATSEALKRYGGNHD